jgi:mevalonate kinase
MQSESASRVSAPGRVILFGEYASDLGFPAVAASVEQRTCCTAMPAQRFMVDGEDLDPARHRLVRAALLHGWPDMDRPLALSLEGGACAALGGDASTIVACMGAMSMLQDHIIYEHVARNAHMAECEAGGARGPLDTSAITRGGLTAMTTSEGAEPLWSIADGGMRWNISGLDVPGLSLVIGFTVAPDRSDLRARVERYCERNGFARDILHDIGEESARGLAALEKGDLAAAGSAMNRTQRLLANLGAGDPALDRLVSAASRHSYGAKATGHSGNAIVALAQDPARAAAAIESAGGRAMVVVPTASGVRPED